MPLREEKVSGLFLSCSGFITFSLRIRKFVSYIYGHGVMISSAYISADKCELQSTQAESPGSQTMAQFKLFLPPFGLHSASKT